MIVRLQNENKIIFNNKLKKWLKIYIVDSLKMFTQLTVCLFKTSSNQRLISALEVQWI